MTRRFFDTSGFCELREGEPDKTGAGGAGGKKDEAAVLPLSVRVGRAQAFIQRVGNAENAVVQLMHDNWTLRKSVEKGQVPAGHRVITADEAKEFDALQALGKAADVKKLLDEHPVLLSEKTAREHSDTWRAAALAEEYNPDVLLGLREIDNLTVEMKTETAKGADGKDATRQVPYVKAKGDDKAQPVKLADYAKQNLAPYAEALKVKGTNGGVPASGGGVSFPKQGSTDQGSGGDLIQKRLDAQKAKAPAFNPLSAAPAGVAK